MNIRSLTFLSALALSLGACTGDDTGDTESTTTATTTSPTTTDTTTSDTTTTTTSDTTTTTSDTTTTTSDTTTTTTTAGESDSTTTTTTGGLEQSCDAYCDLYLSACADFTEYDNKEACVAQCDQWPLGEADALDGDSLGCRIYHATVADSTDPNVHCPHAGPSGDGVCVDEGAPDCGSYCDIYFQNCTDKNDVYEGDAAACMSACVDWYAGSADDVDGDTIGCRTYHAGAALGDAELHCPHASPSGGGVCVVG